MPRRGSSGYPALRRELLEETALDVRRVGPHVWSRSVPFSEQIVGSSELFAPRRIGELLADLLQRGVPDAPLELGS
jgi:hypothetical protein